MIHLVLLGLPPSSNHAYENLPRGGRRLSDQGKRYKLETQGYLASNYRRQMTIFRPNAPYVMAVKFYFEQLVNSGYPDSAKTRYKRVDGSNRVKLLEDTLHLAGGVDDSQTFQSFWEKEQGVPERTLIWVWDREKEGSPFDAVFRSL